MPELTFNKIKAHKSLVENIVEELEEMIVSGVLSPGQRIVEADLCEKMGISRSPLREAFRVLEGSGFLRREPRRGTFVTRVSADEVRQIYQIRASLESLATFLAVQNQAPRVLEELKRLNQQMAEAARKSNLKSYMRLNIKFHKTLVEASQNPRLAELINNFDKQTRRYRHQILTLPGKIAGSLENHEQIIASFEKGDAEQARRLRQDTILANIDIVIRHLKENTDEN